MLALKKWKSKQIDLSCYLSYGQSLDLGGIINNLKDIEREWEVCEKWIYINIEVLSEMNNIPGMQEEASINTKLALIVRTCW